MVYDLATIDMNMNAFTKIINDQAMIKQERLGAVTDCFCIRFIWE